MVGTPMAKDRSAPFAGCTMAASNVTPCDPLTQRTSCCRATTHNALSSQRWSISPAWRRTISPPCPTSRSLPRCGRRSLPQVGSVGDQAAVGEFAVSIDLRAFGPLPGPDCILLRISERAAVGEHIEVIVIPLVRRTAGRGALEDQRHVRALAARNPRGVNYPG